MKSKLGFLLVALLATSGCEVIFTAPPAKGRIVDARSGQPIRHATVTRICAEAPGKATTGKDGMFYMGGKWHFQVAIGCSMCADYSYLIEATNHQSIKTTYTKFPGADPHGTSDDLGVIQLAPK